MGLKNFLNNLFKKNTSNADYSVTEEEDLKNAKIVYAEDDSEYTNDSVDSVSDFEQVQKNIEEEKHKHDNDKNKEADLTILGS